MTSLQPPRKTGGEKLISALDATIQTISIAKDLVPLQIAKGVFSSILVILNIIKTTVNNQNDFQDLVEQCEKIGRVVWQATSDTPEHKINPTILRALSDLKRSVASIQNAATEKTERGIGSKVLKATINQDIIKAWNNELDRFLTLFNVELNIATNMKLDELLAAFRELRPKDTVCINPSLPDSMPPPPRIFVGREDIVQDTIEALLKFQPVALVGPGGMGKSSIARAVLHDEAIAAKFADRRFFVRFDDIDATQVNFATFLDRVARALGLRALANTHAMISKALSSSDVLLILDNAETFLDAASDSGQIAGAIDEFGVIAGVAIMLTTRTTVLPPNIDWVRIRVPVLEESAACEAFRMIYHPSIAASILASLVTSVDFHPLSINLLAQTGTQNEWTPQELITSWEHQRAVLLETGNGKLQSIAVTIETSINAPSITKLGSTIRHLLQIIALLPQGVSRTRLTEIFPTIVNITQCADTLRKHSLAYRKGDYITLLAPVRLYISEKYNLDPLNIPLFQHVQNYYESNAQDVKIVAKDDVNMEHIAALSSRHPQRTIFVLRYIGDFILALALYKPRPTTLYSIVSSLGAQARRSHCILRCIRFLIGTKWNANMAECLITLSYLLERVGQFDDAKKAFAEAQAYFLRCRFFRHSLLHRVYLMSCHFHFDRGAFVAAEQSATTALEYCSSSLFNKIILRNQWKEMHEDCLYYMNITRMKRGRAGASKRLLDVLPRLRNRGVPYIILNALGNAEQYGGRFSQAKIYLQESLDIVDVCDGYWFAEILLSSLDLAYREGDIAESKALLARARTFSAWPNSGIPYVTKLTAVSAVYIAMEGDFAQSQKLMDSIISTNTSVTTVFSVQCTYMAGCIKLLAGERQKAKKCFQEVIEDSSVVSELCFRARAQRALGEIALMEKDFDAAKLKFGETKALCAEMGIPIELLYHDYSCYGLSSEYNGWTLFLEGRLME